MKQLMKIELSDIFLQIFRPNVLEIRKIRISIQVEMKQNNQTNSETILSSSSAYSIA